MTALSEALEEFFREDGWPVQGTAVDGTWLTTIEGSTGRWQVSFEIRRGDILVVRSHAALKAPKENLAAVVEYAARATYGLPRGCIEINVDTGEASVRTSFDAEGVPPEALRRLLYATAYANAHLADRYLPGLLAVALGALDPIMGLPEDERPSE